MRKNKDENDTVSAKDLTVFDKHHLVLKIEIVLNFEFVVSKMKINCFKIQFVVLNV